MPHPRGRPRSRPPPPQQQQRRRQLRAFLAHLYQVQHADDVAVANGAQHANLAGQAFVQLRAQLVGVYLLDGSQRAGTALLRRLPDDGEGAGTNWHRVEHPAALGANDARHAGDVPCVTRLLSTHCGHCGLSASSGPVSRGQGGRGPTLAGQSPVRHDATRRG
eukprot:364865-Chlamydomonas_euryale.AAC.9